MKTKTTALLLIMSLCSARAATSVNTEATQFNSSYTSFGMFGPPMYTSVNTYSPASTVNFTVDYSTLGDDELTFTWSAPVGQQFVINVPASATSGILSFRTDAFVGGLVAGRYQDFAPDYTLALTSGSMPGISNPEITLFALSQQVNGEASLTLTPGSSFSFTSFSLSTTVPAGFNNSFNQPFSVNQIRAVANFGTTNVGDPGQWMSLQAIPEPSALGLLVLGGAFSLRRRRH